MSDERATPRRTRIRDAGMSLTEVLVASRILDRLG